MLRPFAADDVPAAQALTAAFRWPHRTEDWLFAARLGFGIAAELDGAVVGTALAWPYGTRSAALGLVCVQPALQGQGLGRRLVGAVLDELGGDRTVVLHATEEGKRLYGSFGFAADGVVVRQHQGAASGAGLVALPEGCRLRPLGRSDPERLVELDRAATGLPREGLVAALLEEASGIVLDRGGAPLGFALMRRFGRGHVVGPVVAPDEASAWALIGHFLAQCAGRFVRVDVPEATGMSPWLEGLGLADAGPAIRMVRGTPLPAAGASECARTYALSSQAFG